MAAANQQAIQRFLENCPEGVRYQVLEIIGRGSYGTGEEDWAMFAACACKHGELLSIDIACQPSLTSALGTLMHTQWRPLWTG